jgi:hypothetical protein
MAISTTVYAEGSHPVLNSLIRSPDLTSNFLAEQAPIIPTFRPTFQPIAETTNTLTRRPTPVPTNPYYTMRPTFQTRPTMFPTPARMVPVTSPTFFPTYAPTATTKATVIDLTPNIAGSTTHTMLNLANTLVRLPCFYADTVLTIHNASSAHNYQRANTMLILTRRHYSHCDPCGALPRLGNGHQVHPVVDMVGPCLHHPTLVFALGASRCLLRSPTPEECTESPVLPGADGLSRGEQTQAGSGEVP